MNSSEPLKVALYRGDNIESVHRLHYVLSDYKKNIVKSAGNPNYKVYPRSAIKPLQGLMVFESGAFEKFNLSSQEITLACASHNGENEHIHLVKDWLKKIGLDESYLMCGGHVPLYLDRQKSLHLKAKEYTSVYNNCSGKHTGFLSSILSLGLDPMDYLNPLHPFQSRLKARLEDLMDYSFSGSDIGIDGCGIPTYFTPLKNLSFGMSQMLSKNLNQSLIHYFNIIFDSILENPFYLAGTNRLCTQIIENSKNTLVKVGAEGVYVAVLKDQGLALSLKVEDGSLRAAEAGLVHLLKEFNIFDEKSEFSQSWKSPKLYNWVGTLIGKTEVIH